ncbi:sigma-70 family RNA polymerase sigma factor [Nocardioides fonticola]|uniref:Sigma-70 family RNA polymerase sigma factor n=1 Tax=Nocardioides fonticola TaxID=450363 RepID=A0ABP7XCV6_9ACTN
MDDPRTDLPTDRPLADEAGVHAAYLRHGPEIYRFALRSLADPGAAQDATQETFLKAWRHADRFDPELASLRVWLFGIARNVVIDQLRHQQVRPWQRPVEPPTTSDRTPLPADTADDPAEELMTRWVVQEALARIAEPQRAAIVQVHLRQRPYAEVAAELGVPIGTLRSRVFYGLKALRATMDAMGVTA